MSDGEPMDEGELPQVHADDQLEDQLARVAVLTAKVKDLKSVLMMEKSRNDDLSAIVDTLRIRIDADGESWILSGEFDRISDAYKTVSKNLLMQMQTNKQLQRQVMELMARLNGDGDAT